MNIKIQIREGACGPVCPYCDTDEHTMYAEATTEGPSGEILSEDDPETVPHYWCNGCAGLMVIATGVWMIP